MEDIYVIAIVVVIVIVNIVRTYNKEAGKNKDRTITPPPRPFTSTSPTPFSRPQQTAPTPNRVQTPDIPSAKPTEYDPANEGVSAVMQSINKYPELKRAEDNPIANIKTTESASFDLKLDTADDLRRAFIYTQIFDRRY